MTTTTNHCKKKNAQTRESCAWALKEGDIPSRVRKFDVLMGSRIKFRPVAEKREKTKQKSHYIVCLSFNVPDSFVLFVLFVFFSRVFLLHGSSFSLFLSNMFVMLLFVRFFAHTSWSFTASKTFLAGFDFFSCLALFLGKKFTHQGCIIRVHLFLGKYFFFKISEKLCSLERKRR